MVSSPGLDALDTTFGMCRLHLHALGLTVRHLMQAARAFKRNRPVDFEGFDFKGGYGPPPTNGTAWLLSTAGVGDEYYDDYDDNYEDGPPIPDQWDTMEPKYVNDRRVLINKQIE